MSSVYHLRPRTFRGSTLYPLNGLRQVHPDLYARELEKYAGRESMLSVLVPGLDVAWADTCNLAALDPRRLVPERERVGAPMAWLAGRVLIRIPVERLAGRRCVRYQARRHWLNTRPGDPDVARFPPPEDFAPLDPETYAETTIVPAAHIDYLVEQTAKGERALAFAFVPHVLVDGAFDLDGLEPIELCAPIDAGP